MSVPKISEEPDATPALTISVSHDPAINYAFQQNAIPVIRELAVRNDSVPRKDLVIRVRTEPAFALPVELNVQSLEPEGEFHVAPLDLKLSPFFLADVTEKVSGCLHIDLIEGETIVATRTGAITLLAKNEWSGLDSLRVLPERCAIGL